jgi:hypothetical protein
MTKRGSGFIAADGRLAPFLANSSVEPQDKQNRLQPLREIVDLGNESWVSDFARNLGVGVLSEVEG